MVEGQQVPPGYGFSSKAASGRIGAGVRGALATQGKWCQGSGTGPAFPLKAKVLVSQNPSEPLPVPKSQSSSPL